jgi:hypothetical protein
LAKKIAALHFQVMLGCTIAPAVLREFLADCWSNSFDDALRKHADTLVVRKRRYFGDPNGPRRIVLTPRS